MASSLTLFLFTLLISHYLVSAFVFPVLRDLHTGQYLAQLRLGDSSAPINLLLDLGGPLLWYDCSSAHLSSSRTLISGTSSGCLKATVSNQRLSRGRDLNAHCDLLVRNGANGLTARGELARDVLSLGSDVPVDLLFACAPPSLLRGLASGAQGVMGLGRAQISLPSQLAAESNDRRRLTVYLLPSNGVVSTRSVEEVLGDATSRSLVYTPLLTGSSGGYEMNVKSVRVNGQKLAVDGPLTAELSTVVPYTMLESGIYAVFAEAYTRAAKGANATLVAPVAPFGLCFTSTGVVDFPTVDVALQSEMVRWRMQGRNLMVDVGGGGVQCVGVVNGGTNRVSPITMGGLQLEGFVLDFDLGNSMMGFGQRTHSHSQAL